jgi:MFS family permease
MNKQTIKESLRCLRYRNYRLFFIGQVISLVGTWMQNLAMGWLVYRLTHSALALGVVGFSSQISALFVSPFAGVWADRWDRKPLVILSQTLAMFQAFVLSFLVLSGQVQVWHIIGLSVFLGIVSSFDMPVRHSFTADMIGVREDLGNAIALNSMIFNIARFIGPPIAGAIVALWGEGVCFLFNGISYAAVIVALVMMKIPARKAHGGAGIMDSMKEGFIYTFSHAPIRRVIMLMSVISLMVMPYAVLMPVFARDVLKGNSQTLGLLMGAAGLGALAAAVFMASLRGIKGIGARIIWASSITASGLILLSLANTFWLAMPIMGIIGFGMMVHMASSNTFVQTVAADDKRGRVIGFFMLSFVGFAPFGSLLAGWLAAHVGTPGTIRAAGILCLGASALFSRGIRRIERTAVPSAREE